MTTSMSTPVRPTFVPAPDRPPRPGIVRFVDIPPRRCLTVEGEGTPGSPEFRAAIGGLYTTAWTLRFALKTKGRAYKVPALEGLWTRTDDTPLVPPTGTVPDPAAWHWTLLIEAPSDLTEAELAEAIEAGRSRHPEAAFDRIRLISLEEGPAVEALHVGPYATEPETIAAMQAAMDEHGLRPRGPHHEIYLGDPTRAAPDKLKTLLRQAVE
jgi:hypothetical protein